MLLLHRMDLKGTTFGKKFPTTSRDKEATRCSASSTTEAKTSLTCTRKYKNPSTKKKSNKRLFDSLPNKFNNSFILIIKAIKNVMMTMTSKKLKKF
jgi:hypothetical protein